MWERPQRRYRRTAVAVLLARSTSKHASTRLRQSYGAAHIGRRPIAAFGNSTGDEPMLAWTQAGSGPRFMLLVHHDDAAHEYAHGPDAKIGPFTYALMAEATKSGWTVVSVKNDWKKAFAFEH